MSREKPSGGPVTLTGDLDVALSPADAFALFTPRGEERWVAGWHPRFPVPVADDARPGTVFETMSEGETTTWIVLDREPGRRVSYARVTPGSRAGTVTVELSEREGGSSVRVTYALTALSPEGERELREFAAGYPEFLRSWEAAIAALG
ncbi:SRPBCC family protein [Actinomadura rudentiformis]|uniref:SRPBCC family protein n=1 Tax=Actinomadura rudentiformis TaxID=359158 RepID=A0A6H9YTJ1_9ACTN|nr:SRPBCC family protein [Actinomadura rudentiformis]KAB2347490.1 SRPBCC family protein [Actinomadura rudentiformis]